MRRCHGSKDLMAGRGERAGVWDKVPEELEEGMLCHTREAVWLECVRDAVHGGAEIRGPFLQEFVSHDEGVGFSSGELSAQERGVCLVVKWKGRQI